MKEMEGVKTINTECMAASWVTISEWRSFRLAKSTKAKLLSRVLFGFAIRRHLQWYVSISSCKAAMSSFVNLTGNAVLSKLNRSSNVSGSAPDFSTKLRR